MFGAASEPRVACGEPTLDTFDAAVLIVVINFLVLKGEAHSLLFCLFH